MRGDVVTTPGSLSGPTGQRVAAHRAQIRKVLASNGVRKASLFGSVARGTDRIDSDVDILADFPKGTSLFDIFRMQDELERIIGATVDLVPAAGLKDRLRQLIEPDLVAI
jgi:uncharacterized protein